MTDKEKYLNVCSAIVDNFDFGGGADLIRIADVCEELDLDLNDEIYGCFEWLNECGISKTERIDLCGVFYNRLADRFNAIVDDSAVSVFANYFCSSFEFDCWDEDQLSDWLKDNWEDLDNDDQNLVEFVCDDLGVTIPDKNEEDEEE